MPCFHWKCSEARYLVVAADELLRKQGREAVVPGVPLAGRVRGVAWPLGDGGLCPARGLSSDFDQGSSEVPHPGAVQKVRLSYRKAGCSS